MNQRLDPMDEISQNAELRRSLDDAATQEAKSRINQTRMLAFAGGAAAGTLVTLIVLKIRSR